MVMKIRRILPTLSLGALGLLTVAAAGCNRDRVDRDRTGVPGERYGRDDRSGTTTVTGANVGKVGNQTAVDRIVAARCAREASCNNVGPNKHWESGASCTQKVSADMRDDLNARDCPAGIDEKELNECLESIRSENCNNPIDTISRLAACRTSDMCLKTNAPNR
jgi:hypothetical protein